jgi:MraZ protein
MAKPGQTKTKAEDNGTVPYLGQHLRGVDRGRVILPVEWRGEDAPKDFKVIVWPVTTRDYLLVLPPARWEMIQRNLEGLSLADEQAAMVERLISSSTSLGSVDRYGRLGLPEEAAKKLGIEKEAMLVGRLNKFEVWSPSRFAEALARPTDQLIADALKSIKL